MSKDTSGPHFLNHVKKHALHPPSYLGQSQWGWLTLYIYLLQILLLFHILVHYLLLMNNLIFSLVFISYYLGFR
jgi:hypothetical protein